MTAHHILVAPVLIPLTAAILSLLLKNKPTLRNVVVVLANVLIIWFSWRLFQLVKIEGIQHYRFGGWIPPFGIVFTLDLFGSMMVLIGAGISTCAMIYAFGYIPEDKLREVFIPLFFFLWAAINGAFSTGDIFNLFVFFEVMLMSTYCLLAFMGEEKQLEATMKMMTMNVIGSTFLLTAIAILYASLGTLNMADIAEKAALHMHDAPILYASAMLFLVVFGMKAAMVPLHYWLPDAHSAAPTPISAMLSGLLIKVGIYGIVRLFTLLFVPMRGDFQPLLVALACITMLFGAVGAVAQWDIKRLLAYSSISQVGYILLGISFFTIQGLSAALFYIINHAIIKSGLFLTAGILKHTKGSLDMRKHGGLLKQHPVTAGLMLVLAFALAGIPPFNGFFSKYMVIRAAFDGHFYWSAGIALVVSVITLFYISRAWQRICWGEENGELKHKPVRAMLIPVAILVVCCLAFGICANPIIKTTNAVADQLMHPNRRDPDNPKNQGYIQAVMHAHRETDPWPEKQHPATHDAHQAEESKEAH